MRPSAGALVRAAMRPRVLVAIVVLLAAAGACGRLGAWQLDRAHQRSEVSLERTRAARAVAEPVPLGRVLAPQTGFTSDMVGRKVVVRGTYTASGQYLVSGREADGRTGFLVLTPLRVSPNAAGNPPDHPVLPVVRGWVPGPRSKGLEPPSGEVTLVGYLQVSEVAGTTDRAAHLTDAISSGELVNLWGGPIYTGYLVVAESEPEQSYDLALLPPPTPRGAAGPDLANLAYAAQWWIFGAFALALGYRMVRDAAASAGVVPGEPMSRTTLAP